METTNKPPTPAAMSKFWENITPSQLFTCHDCGRTDRSRFVQPQHPYWMDGREGLALCTNCLNEHKRQQAIERKAQFAAMPRCECCTHRATYTSFGVYLCGRHLNNAKRAHERNAGGMGGMGLFVPVHYTPEEIRQMAREERAE